MMVMMMMMMVMGIGCVHVTQPRARLHQKYQPCARLSPIHQIYLGSIATTKTYRRTTTIDPDKDNKNIKNAPR